MDDTFYNMQTEWYINVLYYLDRVLYSYRYYPRGFYTQLSDHRSGANNVLNNFPRDEWWETALIDHHRLVKLFYFCTLKMFMDHNEIQFMRWSQQNSRLKDLDFVDIQYQINEGVRSLLYQLDWENMGYPSYQGNAPEDYWGTGVAYLKNYFEFCRVKELEYFRRVKASVMDDEDDNGMRLNTLLLECITPELYKYLGDHVALLLENFQQDLLFTSEPAWANLYAQVQQWLHPDVLVSELSAEQQRMVYRVQHAQEVSALLALLVDVRGFLTLDFEDDTDTGYYADLQIRQYQRDMEMLNEPRPRIRRLNLEKIRDRYNAESLE